MALLCQSFITEFGIHAHSFNGSPTSNRAVVWLAIHSTIVNGSWQIGHKIVLCIGSGYK